MIELPKAEDKPLYVQNMFGDIAHKYDFMNDLMTFGMHRLWKKQVCKLLEIKEGHKVLDLCCGTGDLTQILAKNSQATQVVGLDFSAEMLSFADKRKKENPLTMEFIQGDALNLPFQPASFDRAVISFGLRNVSDYLKCLQELCRVTKPQAKLAILDLSHPSGFWDLISRPYRFWLLPILGKLLGGSSFAYEYLPNSIKLFPKQEELSKLILKAGFQSVSYKNLFGGLLAIHVACK